MSVKSLIITDYMGGETTEEVLDELSSSLNVPATIFDVIGHYEAITEEAEEKSERADLLIFDYGGVVGLGSPGMVSFQTRWVCEWADNHPGKLVILLTMFTAEIYLDEFEKEFGHCHNIIPRYCDPYSGDRKKISTWLKTLTEEPAS